MDGGGWTAGRPGWLAFPHCLSGKSDRRLLPHGLRLPSPHLTPLGFCRWDCFFLGCEEPVIAGASFLPSSWLRMAANSQLSGARPLTPGS